MKQRNKGICLWVILEKGIVLRWIKRNQGRDTNTERIEKKADRYFYNAQSKGTEVCSWSMLILNRDKIDTTKEPDD